MIEFLILRSFYKKLAEMAVAKNRSAAWGGLGIALWLFGEVLGFVLAGPGEGGGAYLAALLFAALGAGIAFLIVNFLSELPHPDFPTASVHRDVSKH